MSGTNAGTYNMELVPGDFTNNSANFTNVKFVIVDGTLTITKRQVTLTSADDSKVYDSTPLTNDTVTMTGDGWAAGEGATYDVTGSQTLVGSSKNTFDYTLNAGTDEINYAISLVLGTLTVKDGSDPIDPPVPDDLVVTKAADSRAYLPGDVATFTITAINIYDEPQTIELIEIKGVTLAQAKFKDVAPGATITTTATYTITEADLLARSFTNTVTAKVGNLTKKASATIGMGDLNGHLAITKETTSTPAAADGKYTLGERIRYTITVTNDGNLTIRDIIVTDDLTGDTWKIASLAPGASKEFKTSYKVTEADVLAGKVLNEATATGVSPDPDKPDVPVTPGEKEVLTKKRGEAVTKDAFTLLWFSGAQIASEGKRTDALKAMVEWTTQYAAGWDIPGLFGTGSLVGTFNDADTEEKAIELLSKLEQVKPQPLSYYDIAGPIDVNGDAMDYSAYLNRGLLAAKGKYQGGEIWYQLLPEQEIMTLGIGYRKLAETQEEQKTQDEWLRYVNKAIKKHSRYPVILLVNDYMDAAGNLTPFGALIEQEIVAKNPNVRLILSTCESGVVRTSKTYGSRTVNALAFNYASDEENGLGFLRLLTFDPETRSISVRSYSPVYNKTVYDQAHPENDAFILINAY